MPYSSIYSKYLQLRFNITSWQPHCRIPCHMTCRDQQLHFVEQLALAPPEVHIDQQQQQQYEQQLQDAANAPLPDEDDDIAE